MKEISDKVPAADKAKFDIRVGKYVKKYMKIQSIHHEQRYDLLE
jgi:hypothetical protein